MRKFGYWQQTLKGGLVALVSLLVSCAGGSGGGEAETASESVSNFMAWDNSEMTEAEGRMALEKKYADFTDDVKVDKDGRVLADSKRSQFEGKTSSVIGGDWGGKEYAAARYSKKEWSGSQNYEAKAYAGDTESRWSESEWFLRKQAQEAGGRAGIGDKSYQAGNYRTQGALEQGKVRELGDAAQAEGMQRKDFEPPLIIDKRDYSRMTIEDSKNLLGRD